MYYTVMKIQEDLDFGCEELAEDAQVCAVVTLQDEKGASIIRKISDAYLYEQGIDVGSSVLFDEHGKLVLK